jgi:hypothetical protein
VAAVREANESKGGAVAKPKGPGEAIAGVKSGFADEKMRLMKEFEAEFAGMREDFDIGKERGRKEFEREMKRSLTSSARILSRKSRR